MEKGDEPNRNGVRLSSTLNKTEYLDAMRESVDDAKKIFDLLQNALTDDINNRDILMKGIDYSYYYETEE